MLDHREAKIRKTQHKFCFCSLFPSCTREKGKLSELVFQSGTQTTTHPVRKTKTKTAPGTREFDLGKSGSYFVIICERTWRRSPGRTRTHQALPGLLVHLRLPAAGPVSASTEPRDFFQQVRFSESELSTDLKLSDSAARTKQPSQDNPALSGETIRWKLVLRQEN